MKPMGRDGDFERWLGGELQRTVGTASGPSPRAAQATYRVTFRRGGTVPTIKSGILAALTSKGVAAAAVTALAVGGGTAVVAAAATGSADPGTWGQQVVQTVQGCKDTVRTDSGTASGSRGIGRCVSKFASQHGQQMRDEHANDAAGGATESQAGETHGASAGGQGFSGSDHPTAKPSALPTPESKPTPRAGKPAALPTPTPRG